MLVPGQPGRDLGTPCRGYHRDERGSHFARDGGIDTSAIVGNSGLFTTVGDLLRFAQNFGDARVGSRDHLDEMQTAVSLGENGTSPGGSGCRSASMAA